MDELGNFVLQRALDDARNWPHLYISVNLSPLQVRNRGIVSPSRTDRTYPLWLNNTLRQLAGSRLFNILC